MIGGIAAAPGQGFQVMTRLSRARGLTLVLRPLRREMRDPAHIALETEYRLAYFFITARLVSGSLVEHLDGVTECS